MLSIKLKPVGRKRQITYRVVVAERRSKLKGKYIENIGWVDPHQDKFKIDKERAKYWLTTGGAQPTDTVYNFFVRAGVIEGPKRPVHAEKKVSEEEAEASSGQAEAPKEETGEESPEKEEAEAKEEAPAGEKAEEASEEKEI